MGIDSFIKKMMFSRQLDFEEGKFEMLGIRGVILPAHSLIRILEEIYKENGDKLFDMLFEAGKSHGKLGIQKIGSENKIPKREFFDQVFESGNIMGLGKAEIALFNPKKKKLKVTLEGSPLVEEFRGSDVLNSVDRPINEFLRGTFHAMAASVFDSDVVSKETQCAFLGNHACEFIIKADSE